MRRRDFLAGLAALGASPVWAQTLKGAELRGDIALLRKAYEEMHPGLHRYATPAQMDVRFERLAEAWSRDQTRAEAYLSLSRFLGGVRCGHTYANFYNQSDAVADELFAGATRLPFYFRWIDGRMVVTDPKGAQGLARGDVVERIDGRKAAKLLPALLPYARADGGNDAKRVSLLGVSGAERFETFDVFAGLLAPPRDGGFALTLAGGRRVDVPAIDLAARRAQAPIATQDKDAPAFTLGFDTAGVATLTMSDWALYDSKWDWQGFLDEAFREIAARRSPALLCDLRGNEGGSEACGEAVIARCIDRDLPLAAYDRLVRYRQAPAALEPYLDTWDPSFKDWGARAQPFDDRYFRLVVDDGAANAPITPKGPRFSGKLIVLVDAANSSATFQFANLVQRNRLGVLVGEPTGGNRRGINGGAYFFFRLPASGLEADLPLIATFPKTPQPDAGLLPDVSAPVTIEAIRAGEDPAMAAARALA